MTRASIVVPIHDKADTLPLTVDTALRQSVSDIEVLLVGDGVTEPVRRVVEHLTAADERVRFLDHPKGAHHGERYRHDAVVAARSEAILYLCDDDLLLPDHVADLLTLLNDVTFAMSLNGFWRPEGSMGFYPGDLSNPRTVAAILNERVTYNVVSITGAAHRRSFYLDVGKRWDTTPPGHWPDHHQWRKLMRHPAFQGATSHRMTALQFPTSSGGRDRWSDDARLEELKTWHTLVTGPDAQARIDEIVARDMPLYLAELAEALALLEHEHRRRNDPMRLARGAVRHARRRIRPGVASEP